VEPFCGTALYGIGVLVRKSDANYYVALFMVLADISACLFFVLANTRTHNRMVSVSFFQAVMGNIPNRGHYGNGDIYRSWLCDNSVA
jgi:hypothetical protein